MLLWFGSVISIADIFGFRCLGEIASFLFVWLVLFSLAKCYWTLSCLKQPKLLEVDMSDYELFYFECFQFVNGIFWFLLKGKIVERNWKDVISCLCLRRAYAVLCYFITRTWKFCGMWWGKFLICQLNVVASN
jgi:hypothetical protein